MTDREAELAWLASELEDAHIELSMARNRFRHAEQAVDVAQERLQKLQRDIINLRFLTEKFS